MYLLDASERCLLYSDHSLSTRSSPRWSEMESLRCLTLCIRNMSPPTSVTLTLSSSTVLPLPDITAPLACMLSSTCSSPLVKWTMSCSWSSLHLRRWRTLLAFSSFVFSTKTLLVSSNITTLTAFPIWCTFPEHCTWTRSYALSLSMKSSSSLLTTLWVRTLKVPWELSILLLLFVLKLLSLYFFSTASHSL